MNKILLSLCIGACICAGCSGNNDLQMAHAYMDTYKEIKERQIVIGPDVKVYRGAVAGKKTKYTIVNFINTECGNCYTRMDEWQAFLSREDINAHVVFITSGGVNDYFKNYVDAKKDLRFSIYLDSAKKTMQQAKLIEYDKESFLTDETGHILLMGDPVKNANIRTYFNTILSD